MQHYGCSLVLIIVSYPIVQVSRVKSETLNLVQQESEKDTEKALQSRDKHWEDKLSQLEDDQAKKLARKVSSVTALGEGCKVK